MNDNYHIFSDGRVERHNNTVRLVTDDDEKKYLPIENAEALYLHGQIDFNTRVVSFLDDHGVAMHVFGWNDYYSGSIMPERGQTSGQTVVAQVRAYDDATHRNKLAREIVEGSIHNMRANVTYYDNRGYDLASTIDALNQRRKEIQSVASVEEAMGVEASARRAYYAIFDQILPEGFVFGGRKYNPPNNKVNSLISFGNSLVYANIVSAIRATALDPTISYLHEPGERRYSLALDLADLFKPVLTDRVLFRLVNRGQLSEDDFDSEINECLLTEGGREIFSKEFEQTLDRTIKHPRLNRKVSYQYLLRVEAYKLKKHLLTGEPYESFERWW